MEDYWVASADIEIVLLYRAFFHQRTVVFTLISGYEENVSKPYMRSRK
jgi:hypothetical protein